MDIVGTYLLYLLISIGLTIVVGTGLARSGRAFLLDVFSGDDTLARAVSRLLVLGFYLLSLGFVVLTMRTQGDIASARAGLQLLSVKIGEVLLVLGVLHLAALAALAKTRRRAQARMPQPGQASLPDPVQPRASLPQASLPRASLLDATSANNSAQDRPAQDKPPSVAGRAL